MDGGSLKRGTGGRPPKAPKGELVKTSVNLPREVVKQAQLRADRQGVPVTDIVAQLCCQALGIEVPTYCLPKTSNQRELPLAEAS